MESRETRVCYGRRRWSLTLVGILFLILGCSRQTSDDERLIQVNLLDTSGFSEVITSKDRLEALEGRDFIGEVQPYQKVSRLYKKKRSKETAGILTSYHPNGQIYQYLETRGAYANGAYREWHQNGRKKIEAHVISGKADLDPHSACSWVFDGLSQVWNESGQLEAEMTYGKGLLFGLVTTYYPSGSLKGLERYENGKRLGKSLHFYPSGSLYKEQAFTDGLRDGETQLFAPGGERVALETFCSDKLERGIYFTAEGIKIAEVESGRGEAIYPRIEGGQEIHAFQGGESRQILLESIKGHPVRSWELSRGRRHGKELIYDEMGQLRTEIGWHEGRVHGEQRSWYANGQIESLRIMENNKRSGPCTAWYEDGGLMLVEEYDDDRLVEGQYFRKGEKEPISKVRSGRGIATLFDSKGMRLKKITYDEGEPKPL